jgi:hypothetical protein
MWLSLYLYLAGMNRLRGRVGEAIDLCLDIARVYKKFPHVHFKLGYLFLAIQDYPNAVRHFTLEIERYMGSSSPNVDAVDHEDRKISIFPY